MASLSEIQGYTGNAGLGAGSAAGSVLPTKTDFDAVNRAGEQWALQKVTANKNIFDQKVKERDYQRNLFENGQIKVGQHLESEQKVISDSQKEVNDAYEKFVKAPPSDTKALQDYQNAHTKYAEIVTQAQSNYASKYQYDADIAKEPVKSKQEAMIKHRDEEMKKGFYAMKAPYRKAVDYDPQFYKSYDKAGWSRTGAPSSDMKTGTSSSTQSQSGSPISSGSSAHNLTTTSTKTNAQGGVSKTETVRQQLDKPTKGQVSVGSEPEIDPKTGFVYIKQPDSYYDAKSVQKQISEDFYAFGEKKDQMDDDANGFNAADGKTQKEIVEGILSKVNEYNETVGDQSGNHIALTENDIAQSTMQKDQFGNNKYILKAPQNQFTFLKNLASQSSFKTSGGKVIDENLTKAQLDRTKETDRMIIEKGKRDLGYAKIAAQTKFNHDKLTALTGADVEPFLSNQFIQNLTSQVTATGTVKGTNDRKVNSNLSRIEANNSIPLSVLKEGKIELFKPIGAKAYYEIGRDGDHSKPALDKDKAEKDKVTGYEGGHYDVLYMQNNKAVTKNSIGSAYSTWVTNAINKGFKKEDIPSADEYLQQLLLDKKSGLSFSLKGDKETMTERSYIESQKALNNKFTKSKQQGIISTENFASSVLNDNGGYGDASSEPNSNQPEIPQ